MRKHDPELLDSLLYSLQSEMRELGDGGFLIEGCLLEREEGLLLKKLFYESNDS